MSNAEVLYDNGQNYGDEVTYMCVGGYTFSAEDAEDTTRESSCQADGTWAPVDGTCIQVSCDDPPSIPHSSVSPANSSPYVSYDWITYTCDEGYSFSPEDSADKTRTSTCQPSGTWEDVGMCKRPCMGDVTVGAPPEDSFADVTKYLKHDTERKYCQLDLKNPMPCDGKITQVDYQAKGSDNDRDYHGNGLFFFSLHGQDSEGSCEFANTTGRRIWGSSVNSEPGPKEHVLADMNAGEMPVKKGDHFAFCWKQYGVVAYDQYEDSQNTADTLNYCYHGTYDKNFAELFPEVGEPLSGFKKSPAGNRNSPSYRDYAIRVHVSCDCEGSEYWGLAL
jgi:hypothetical protein